MRNRGKGEPLDGALKLLERNFDRLRSLLSPAAPPVGFFELTDIFQETVLLISSDTYAAEMVDDAEFVRYFKFKFNMVLFQTRQDQKIALKKYADYQKAQKQKAENWR